MGPAGGGKRAPPSVATRLSGSKIWFLPRPPPRPPPPTHTPGMRVATCAPVAREQQRCLPAREQQRCLPDAARTPGVYAQAEYGARIRKLICAKKLMPRATH